MKKQKQRFSSVLRTSGLLSLLLALCLLLSSCLPAGVRKISFRYQSGTQDEESYLYYTDAFFDHPATQYDPSLATASLSFAMASFASIDDYSYAHRYINGEEVLRKAGFKDIEANAYFHEKPGTDSLGVMIGRKDLDGITLLAVGLRGANYESEWASNFTVGEGVAGGYHQGFYEASEIVLAALKAYVESHALTGRLKIWISGYSRAGASCNVASGRMDEYICDGVSFLGDKVQLAKEDLYAYCFEAPRGVPLDEDRYAKSGTFGNIFCIINPNDPVPKTAMEAMGFTRFGREIVLPTTLSDLNFEASLEEIERQFRQLRSFGDWGTYRISDFTVLNLGGGGRLFSLTPDEQVRNWTQAQYLDELLGTWAEIGIESRAVYTADLQQGLRDLFRLVYLRKNTSSSLKDIGLQFAREVITTDEVSVLTDDLMHNRSRLMQDAEPIIHRALQRMGVDTDLDAMKETLVHLLETLLKALIVKPYLFSTLFSLDNMKAISSAHYPELCLAYMRAMDPYYTETPLTAPLDGKYYQLLAPAGTEISVRQGDKLIAAIRDDTPEETDCPVPCGLWGYSLQIVLPAHEAYEVTVSSDQEIVLKLIDPGLSLSEEIPLSFTQTAEGYRFGIAPAE